MSDEIRDSDTPADFFGQPDERSVCLKQISARFDRADWLGFVITSVLALAVYLFTLAPEVTLEFSGILSTGARYAGVPHPPGYPVWTIYSWFFTRLLPFSNIAWRVAVGSAVAAALACGLVALMVSRGGKMLLEKTPAFARWEPAEQNLLRMVCGYVAGMAFGLSGAVWREAVLADTWALSVLLFAMMLGLLLRWTVVPERRRFLYGAFFVFGLLLTSNQELITVTPALLLWVMLGDWKLGRDVFLVVGVLAIGGLLAGEFGLFPWFDSFTCRNLPLLVVFLPVIVAAVAAIIATHRIGSEWKPAIVCGMVLLLGIGFYFYLPVASMTNPPVNWAYPRTLDGFFHAVTRGQYERANPTRDLGRFFAQLWMLTKDTGKEFGWLYFVLAVLPLGFL
ncbi:MAG: DUF2723 domain-containing protein, partial [Bryobacteraceae bacterium]